MGRTGELIEGIQKRLEDIETEATRLIVFANSTSDAALGSRLKKIAKIIFRSATEIEDRLKTLK
jgi:ribosomal protein L7Ae-like RNA K-turn-binding protein